MILSIYDVTLFGAIPCITFEIEYFCDNRCEDNSLRLRNYCIIIYSYVAYGNLRLFKRLQMNENLVKDYFALSQLIRTLYMYKRLSGIIIKY